MSKLLLLSLGLVLASATACQNIQSEDFDTSLASNDYILLNVSGKSCKAQIFAQIDDDVSPIKAVFRSIRLRWTGKNPLNLIYVRITFNGSNISGGSQSTVLSGEDLAYAWTGTSVLNPFQPMDAYQETTRNCQLEIGGIGMSNPKKDSYGTGTVEFYGTTLEGDVEIPATSQTFFTYQYKGF